MIAKRTYIRYSIALFVFFSILPVPLQHAAASTSTVGGAVVHKHRHTAEYRIGKNNEGRLRTRLHYDYGFTDFYAGRITFSMDRRKGGNLEAEAVGFDNRFHLLRSADHGFDLSARIALNLRDGNKKPDRLSFRLDERFRPGTWEIRLNQIFTREIGQEQRHGIAFEFRSQITHGIGTGGMRIGLESFNNFGKLNRNSNWSDQDHTAGVLIKNGFGDGYFFDLGTRTSLSRAAPDHSLRFSIGRNW